MTKYEYLHIRARNIINHLRETNDNKDVGGEVLLFQELNRLGSEGWDIIPMGPDDYFGKRVKDGARASNKTARKSKKSV